MNNQIAKVDLPSNEPILDYKPGSEERQDIVQAIKLLRNKEIDIPMYIGDKEIYTSTKIPISPPHDHKHILGYFNKGNKDHISQAIKSCLDSKKEWECMRWEDRASIFLKAADIASTKYRNLINATTMLGQSKNIFQAEIDAVCELVDFLKFNVYYMQQIYSEQPVSSPAVWNRLEYRPLEGFVVAITPFNFTSIAANLAIVPALMGNTVIWKPSDTQIYSAKIIMELLLEAGLPKGVINLVYTEGQELSDIAFNHPEFAGLNFTGSTATFKKLWRYIGNNIEKYRSYPRIVGETGGKDFIIAHSSAETKSLVTALIRGGFEYQGQKCSAASRAYIPKSLWNNIKKELIETVATIKIGGTEDLSNFMNAVIDAKAFNKITNYINTAKGSSSEVLTPINYSDQEGYFISPTIIQADNPHAITMEEEIFGPVLTIYVYEDDEYQEILETANNTSPYGLTGAIFAQDRKAIIQAMNVLRHAAGNFYINDKPTGAVVGNQPFGGARQSGTNDKAGSSFNLLRWVSPRTIKENFTPPQNYKYPFMR